MDQIEICNLALARIGIDIINSLDEASEPARLCKQFYNTVRKTVLRKFPWTFSIRRVGLALLDETPANWLYAYQYPADCLCVRKLYNENYDNIPDYTQYQMVSGKSGRVLYTNIKNASAEYTANITDCNLFDDQFVEALTWKLASEIAFKLTGNTNLQQMAVQMYASCFVDAAANDADEQNVLDPDLDRLALARFNGLG